MRFFKPDKEFINWLIELANNKIIVDVGCGEGDLLIDLAKEGYTKLIGIEPFMLDPMEFTKKRLTEVGGTIMIHMLHGTIQDQESFIKPIKDKCIFLICRPCHGYFVDSAINVLKGQEVYYIGLEKNLEVDLEGYNYELIQHKGTSEDEEKVYKLNI